MAARQGSVRRASGFVLVVYSEKWLAPPKNGMMGKRHGCVEWIPR